MCMRLALTNYSPFIDEIAAAAARTCRSEQCVDRDELGEKQVKGTIEYINDVRHYSTLEHNILTFMVDDISRVCSHQLVRHRHGSYSQQSHRMLKKKSFRQPSKGVASNPEALRLYNESSDRSYGDYEKLIALGVPEEEARDVLPQRITTSLYFSCNATELLNSFFPQRLCERAQGEINSLAYGMLVASKLVAPVVFAGAGTNCAAGRCREKEKTERCGGALKRLRHADEIAKLNMPAFHATERGRYLDVPLELLDLAYDMKLLVRKI
ncbi:MAG: FAD-dependent thymidylate synthase [Candidatus Aenigmatarchaeota archaeon]